ncbi:MAG: lysylphosphatidylglycerol synthase domain-containing protein [Lysobacteraceae bacterium]
MFLAAVSYLALHLRGDANSVPTAVAAVGLWPLLGATILIVTSLLFQATYHALLLERFSDSSPGRREVIAAYLQAQVVRYLPGKIWGVVYQSQKLARRSAPVYVVLANLWQMLVSTLLTAGLVAAVGAGVWLSPLWLWAILPVFAIIEWLHQHPKAESAMFRVLAKRFPRLGLVPANSPKPLRWRGTALLFAEWSTYLLAFVVLLVSVAHPLEALTIGFRYAAASMVALIAFVVPAGLAVREAIFLSVPHPSGLPLSLLTATAVLIRISQFAAELLLAVAAGMSAGTRRE